MRKWSLRGRRELLLRRELRREVRWTVRRQQRAQRQHLPVERGAALLEVPQRRRRSARFGSGSRRDGFRAGAAASAQRGRERRADDAAEATLVERFDVKSYSDFSSK